MCRRGREEVEPSGGDGRKAALDPQGALESWVGLRDREKKMES